MSGFGGMAATSGDSEIASIGIGMLGYAFMGKAHANGYKTLAYMAWPPPLMPELVAIAGRDEAAVSEAAAALRLRALRDGLARAAHATTGSACSTTRARTTCTRSRPWPPRRRAST